MWAWPFPWVSSGNRGGLAGPLGPVWEPLGCGRYPGPGLATLGTGQWLGSLWPPWGRGRSPRPGLTAVGACQYLKPGLAAVEAWPVPWARSGCRGGVAGPLKPVWLSWGRGRSFGHGLPVVKAGRSPGPGLIAMGS